MKIAVSSSGNTSDTMVDLRFGRCEYFMIYDTETKEYKALENDGQKASGGAGIAASNQIVNENINVIITGQLGPNAFEIISKSNIDVFTCGVVTIKEAINKYEKGELAELSKPVPAHYGMGHR